MKNKQKILIVEDKKAIGEDLQESLIDEGYTVELVFSSQEFDKLYKKNQFIPDLILLDIQLNGSELDGVELFKKFSSYNDNNFNPEVIIMSSEATRKQIAETIKLGAYDYFEKNYIGSNFEKFLIDIENAMKHKKQNEKIDELELKIEELNSKNTEDNKILPFIGESSIIRNIKSNIKAFGKYNSNILLVGATGTGKEIIANNLHYYSDRKDKELKIINCSAIPDTLFESELFGHEKGSFTGAVNKKKGMLEVANGSTLFMDEIETLSLEAQSKMLRVLENNEYMNIGSTSSKKIDIRFIFGSNKDLIELVQTNKMREDFYYRITSSINVVLPSLIQRDNDILLLFKYFINLSCKEFNINLNLDKINYELVIKKLLTHNWNGNIRELKSFTTKLIINNSISTNKAELTTEDVLEFFKSETNNILNIRKTDRSSSKLDKFLDNPILQDAKEQFESEYIKFRLKKNNWKKEFTANEMEYDRVALYRKIKKYGIKKDG